MRNIYKYIIAIVIGVFVGVITLIGQKYLPINFNFLANSGAIWLIPAFLLSCYFNLEKKESIFISTICLLSCVFGYYIFESIVNNHSFQINNLMVVWIMCAIIGGIVIGLGTYFFNNEKGILKKISSNLLPAIFVSEELNKIIHIDGYKHMIPATIIVTCIGLILYFIINKKESLHRNNIITFAILCILGLVFYEFIFWITL